MESRDRVEVDHVRIEELDRWPRRSFSAGTSTAVDNPLKSELKRDSGRGKVGLDEDAESESRLRNSWVLSSGGGDCRVVARMICASTQCAQEGLSGSGKRTIAFTGHHQRIIGRGDIHVAQSWGR